MGMFDNVVVEGGISYNGKTYSDFQTKDLDCHMNTIAFGKALTKGSIPVSDEFVFYGVADEDEARYAQQLHALKGKHKGMSEEYHAGLRELDRGELVEFVGLFNQRKEFCMVLSLDRSQILKSIPSTAANETAGLYGLDDGKVCVKLNGKEICLNNHPVLMAILAHNARLWLEKDTEEKPNG